MDVIFVEAGSTEEDKRRYTKSKGSSLAVVQNRSFAFDDGIEQFAYIINTPIEGLRDKSWTIFLKHPKSVRASLCEAVIHVINIE